MTSHFHFHTIDSAPESSQLLLEAAQAKFGFVPNLLAGLAESPVALQAYLEVSQIFQRSTLSPTAQQIVLLTTSLANRCTYCVAAHSAMLAILGFPMDQLRALREGRPLADARLDALRRLTAELVIKRGWPAKGSVQAFLAAGYSRAQVLDVLVGIAQKTVSNYVNHLAETPLDPQFQQFAWEPEPVAP